MIQSNYRLTAPFKIRDKFIFLYFLLTWKITLFSKLLFAFLNRRKKMYAFHGGCSALDSEFRFHCVSAV
jgi:hypothetical protein